MAQQTAVEWLDIELWKLRLKLRGGEISLELYGEQEVKLIKQAKKMEKEQIVTAWLNGDNDSMYDPKQLEEQAEQYYNETYNK